MRIGENQRWPDFYANWSNKLTEARGDLWDDANKISMIKNSLNDMPIKILAGNHLLPENDFHEWIRIVNQVAQQPEMLESRSRRHNSTAWHIQGADDFNRSGDRMRNAKEAQNREADCNLWLNARIRQPEFDGSGDVVMGGINAAGIAGGDEQNGRVRQNLAS